MSTLMMFMPPELAVLLLIGAGFALIVGARKIAGAMAVGFLAILLLPMLIAPIMSFLPLWVLLLLLVFLTFSAIRAVITLIVGRAVADHAFGTLLADAIRAGVIFPFRLLGGLTRLAMRKARR